MFCLDILVLLMFPYLDFNLLVLLFDAVVFLKLFEVIFDYKFFDNERSICTGIKE